MQTLPTNLNSIDYVVVALTIAVLFAIGLRAGRRHSSTNEFFLAGRHIPAWAACISFVATEISAITIISVPATAYRENWEYLQFFIGSASSRIVLAFVFIPAFYRYNVTTIYEFLRHRFGPLSQYAATCFFFVTRLMGSGVRLTVACSAVAVLIGWAFLPTLILFSLAAMIYISWGGIRAVVWTNVWQGITFIVGGLGALIFLASVVPGGLPGILSIAHSAGKLQILDWGPRVGESGFWSQILTNPNIWWLAILNGFFGSLAAYGTDHELMQRLLTVDTRKRSQRTTLATPLAGLSVLSIFMLIGTGLFAFYQTHPNAPLPAKIDDIFPLFAGSQMPAVLRGLVLAAVIMASIDSPLGSLTASFVTDIYRPLIRKDATDRHYLIVARVMVVIFGVILAVLAWSFSFLSGFLWWAFKITGVTFGSLLGVFLLGLLTRSAANRANVVAMVTMALINLVLLILSERQIFVIGWTWLVILGTFGTMGLSRLLAPLLDRDAVAPPAPTGEAT